MMLISNVPEGLNEIKGYPKESPFQGAIWTGFHKNRKHEEIFPLQKETDDIKKGIHHTCSWKRHVELVIVCE